ncbi:hydrogenase maturation nickel metallochaperone HypA [Halobellus inordinatus]|uniref:hydrogenase maturation nickel metallochaperone HypA n=1 Tax=Halobellus inordinatus TaxID=1126236 RepID=UPI00210E3BE3|nr:hydrogenase maturation nickel metallochaperone HypA [Halobellus inordinatus]
MRIRGRRRCKDCGREWSYFDTGQVNCPDCGSMRSVGTGDRERHTDSAVELDLSAPRAELDDATDIDDIASELKTTLRDYVRQRGFVRAGELQSVDDTVLAAAELLHAVDIFGRTRDPDDEMQWYVLELLRGADDGQRPDPSSVPASMTDARGLAYAEVLDAFCSDLGTWLDDNPDPAARQVRETLATHVKRVDAVYGDVPAEESELLVRAARDLVSYLVDDDEMALTTAQDRLSRLG